MLLTIAGAVVAFVYAWKHKPVLKKVNAVIALVFLWATRKRQELVMKLKK